MAGSVIGRAWRAFRRWRRSRPFWAGLFLLLSGLVVIFPPFAGLKLGAMAMSMQTLGGLSGALIGTLMVVCALTMWIRPQFRIPAAVAAMIMSLAAIITTNFGGFLLGTLLGLIGTGLAMAWTPKARKRKVAKAVPPAAVALVLLAGLAVHNVSDPTVALADPAPTSTTVTTSSSEPPATATTTVAPTSTTSPSSSSSATASSTTTATTSTTSATPSPPALPAGTRVWTLTSPSIAMSGLSYKGIVDAVVGTKTIKVLKFTASSVKIKDMVQTATSGGGHKIVTTAAPGSTSTITGGTITMLTAEIKGTAVVTVIPGLPPIKLPIDYTATSPPLLTPAEVTFENVTVTNTDQSGGVLTIPGAKIAAT
ncbi:DUF6114 domain-containing protein [Kutzneria sp. NPDC052558]|uniref:DUF6114 domain-containing protein n=1 Tax=Kutzneria sp. NPDC052558 TaxID=3364121 RepID=UPI0037C807E0